VVSEKLLSSTFRKNNCLVSAYMTSKMSSAYCTIGKSAFAWGMGGQRRPCDTALFTRIWSSSTARTKINGERGSPWRTPLRHLNFLPGTPFKITVEVPVDRILLIQAIHLCGKPTWGPLLLFLANVFVRCNGRKNLSNVNKKRELKCYIFYLCFTFLQNLQAIIYFFMIITSSI
jgi:hypothetical protein